VADHCFPVKMAWDARYFSGIACRGQLHAIAARRRSYDPTTRCRGETPLLRSYYVLSRRDAAPAILLRAIVAGRRSYDPAKSIVGAASRRDYRTL